MTIGGIVATICVIELVPVLSSLIRTLPPDEG